MKTLSITYAKNHFSALVREVQQGTSILVSDYGKPVVRLEPVMDRKQRGGEGVLVELEKRGIIRRPSRDLPEGFLEATPPRTRDGSSVVDALLKEREDGR